jgi:hypothetical protein
MSPPQWEVENALGPPHQLQWFIDGWSESLSHVHWVIPFGTRTIVSQGSLATAIVFDSAGSRVGVVGRRGEGPGEFQALTSPRTVFGARRPSGTSAGQLWVWDSGLRRISWFDRDLELVDTRTVTTTVSPTDSPFETMSVLTVRATYPDGSVLVLAAAIQQRGTSEARPTTALVRVFPDGTSEVSAWLPADPAAGRSRARFAPAPIDDVDPSGRWVAILDPLQARGTTVLLTLIGESGDTVHSSFITYTPVPIPGPARKEAIDAAEEFDARIRRGGGSPRERMPVPSFYPAVADVVVGSEGTTYLRLAGRSPATWLTVDSLGVVADTIRLPREERVHAAWGDRLWTVRADSFDVPSVALYQRQR